MVAFDRSIGILRKKINELGVSDNTIIWYCSDNGGLKNISPSTVGNLRGGKNTMWEGGLRVPSKRSSKNTSCLFFFFSGKKT